jgi:hypothetical protein
VQAQPASNLWKKSFQCLEKRTPFFPMLGKTARKISNVWKKAAGFFQASENQTEILPTLGKKSPIFSNAWKHFFQPPERRAEILPTFGWNPSRPRTTGRIFSRVRKEILRPLERCPRLRAGESPALRGAVKDASTDWNDGVSSVCRSLRSLPSCRWQASLCLRRSECFTFLVPP